MQTSEQTNIQTNVQAAVAIIQAFVPDRRILLLRRAVTPDDPWSGHFAFPGGRLEPEDENLLATAIRETGEETGILLKKKYLTTELPPQPAGQNLTFPSYLWVQPYLFTLPVLQSMKLDSTEIQSAQWLKAIDFTNKKQHIKTEILPGKILPVFPLDDYYLWGFTYRLMETLLTR